MFSHSMTNPHSRLCPHGRSALFHKMLCKQSHLPPCHSTSEVLLKWTYSGALDGIGTGRWIALELVIRAGDIHGSAGAGELDGVRDASAGIEVDGADGEGHAAHRLVGAGRVALPIAALGAAGLAAHVVQHAEHAAARIVRPIPRDDVKVVEAVEQRIPDGITVLVDVMALGRWGICSHRLGQHSCLGGLSPLI